MNSIVTDHRLAWPKVLATPAAGPVCGWLVLACVAVVAGFLVDPRVVIGAAIIYGVLIAYFAFYSRHHLVAGTPEEEFAAIQAAEAALH